MLSSNGGTVKNNEPPQSSRKLQRGAGSSAREEAGVSQGEISGLSRWNLLPWRFQNDILNAMIVHSWTVNLREEGLLLLEAVNLRIPAAPRGFLGQLARKQRILLNGAPASGDNPVKPGDILSLRPSSRINELIAESRLAPAQILYEDGECMVLDKPAGLMTHPAGGHADDLLTRLKNYLGLRNETFQVGPIHRLDIGTSGPILYGKGRSSISALGKMLMAGELRKDYLALVSGHPPPHGVLDSTVPGHGKDKASLTRYRRLATGSGHTLLALELITGRRHQIRRQLADAGWPIDGDRRYRGAYLPGLLHPFLHCYRLAFRLPGDGRRVEITSPLPSTLRVQLSDLGIDQHAILAATQEIPHPNPQ